jgi:hypothetical protein
MKTSKIKGQKAPEKKKAPADERTGSPVQNKKKASSKISPDTLVAEKDEVKNAEERLRQKINKK